jgi:hypothetical protein
MLITADLQSQKGPLPKCCPSVSDMTKNVRRCPKVGVRNRREDTPQNWSKKLSKLGLNSYKCWTWVKWGSHSINEPRQAAPAFARELFPSCKPDKGSSSNTGHCTGPVR